MQGGKILTGGVADDGAWLVRPTIITDLPLTAPQYCEEIFGPVCVVNKFETEDEALQPGQRHPLRPQRDALHREPLARAPCRVEAAGRHRVGQLLLHPRPAHARSAGSGDSGVGREGGNFSREFFTEPKAVVMQIDRG